MLVARRLNDVITITMASANTGSCLQAVSVTFAMLVKDCRASLLNQGEQDL
jgi:hypothetical protein